MDNNAADNRDRQEAYLKEVVETLSEQSARAPIPVLLSGAFVSWISWTRGPPPVFVAMWFSLLALGLLARWLFARDVLMQGSIRVERELHILWFFNLWNGIIAGFAAVAFMPHLALEWQAILTMILMAWASGSVTLSGSSLRSFYCFTIPLAVLLAASWAAAGKSTVELNVGIAFLVALFFVVQTTFARHTERVFHESFDMRYENLRLVKELKEANESKSRFLADASHDLRQPMNVIALNSASLSLRAADERTAALTENISHGVEQLKTLLDALLDLSKIDAGAVEIERSTFDLSRFVAEIAAEYGDEAARRGLRLEVQVEPNLFVFTDRFQLGRILRNLVDNALKYTPAGFVRLQAHARDAQVVVEVVDSGLGIPADKQKQVFEEFVQLNNPGRDFKQGLGLGLAIVKRLASMLDIALTLESTPGLGSTFALRVPLAMPVADDHSLPERAAGIEWHCPPGFHALVIDDQEAILLAMRAFLENLGCKVSTARTAAEAMDLIALERPDVVITDYRLQSGETGIEALNLIGTRYGSIPAIIVTGDTTIAARELSTTGPVRVLHKPVDVRQLVTQLKGIVA